MCDAESIGGLSGGVSGDLWLCRRVLCRARLGLWEVGRATG